MVGLDTPRTNVGDATYLSRQPDFDMTQEPSFQSPSKEPNVFQSLRNGGGRQMTVRTPRGKPNRNPLTDRANLPAGLGGAEFTPLLKSATRNSARRRSGKENGLTTPANNLGRVDEDITPIPGGESSVYRSSRDASYVGRTPLPEVDSDSTASTPMIMRRGNGKNGGGGGGLLGDGQQLSLREQENVIDKIEKENFGLKLKIHFLEDALHKAGPGLSEAALKENTDLKVDKVTMQKELQRWKKHHASAEKELKAYRQQIQEVQQKMKNKHAGQDHSAELERLQRALDDKKADVEDLQRQQKNDQRELDKIEKLQDEIADLELDLREKDRIIDEHEDKLEVMRSRVQQAEDKAKDAQIRMIELEEKAQSSDKLKEAKETIEDLEADVRDLERQVDDMKDKLDNAVSEKDRAENDLEELQEEMANKSVHTKGLSRQVEEKMARLQDEVEAKHQDYLSLEKQFNSKHREIDDLKLKLKESRQERDSSEKERRSLATMIEELRADLNIKSDEKNLLQSRHDALTSESASLQKDVSRLQKSMSSLEEDLEQERQHSLDIEREIRAQYKVESDKLNDEISDLQAEVREKENLYDNDSEKWETERHNLESERDRAENRAAGLQKTIEKLRDAEGSLTSKESKLKEALQSETERHQNEEAVLSRQIEDLQQDLEGRQQVLEDLRNELSAVRDELRQSQLDKQAEIERAEALEDEIEVLQTTLDDETEKATQDLDKLNRECDGLRKQLTDLRKVSDSVRSSSNSSREKDEYNKKAIEHLEAQVSEYKSDVAQVTNEKKRLQDQLSVAKGDLTKVRQEKKDLQDQLATVKNEAHSLKTSLAETEAERDEIDAELNRLKQNDNDTFQIDQERIDLRSAKARLENEIRRLKEDNKTLTDHRQQLEKALEDELDKAEAEEERLNQQIIDLQAKTRHVPDNQELVKARRTIRDLERRVEGYEHQLAQNTVPVNIGEGSSELSLIKRDLAAARQKELETLQHETAHRETVRGLKRKIGDLERRIHDAEITRLITSPKSQAGSAHKAEVSELRHQLSIAHQSIHDLKKSLKESERKAATVEREVRARLDDVEEQKIALEQALEDAQQAADDANADLRETIKKYKTNMDRYKKERDTVASTLADTRRGHLVQQQRNNTDSTIQSEISREERHDLYEIIRKSQIDADRLEKQLREHKDALDELVMLETALRTKLDRARKQREEYRADNEAMTREYRALKKAKEEADVLREKAEEAKEKAEKAAAAGTIVQVERQQQIQNYYSFRNGHAVQFKDENAAVKFRDDNDTQVHTDAIIRAAEAAEHKHVKQMRGMCMQVDWMQARWERELRMRDDAAFAKGYLLAELEVRDACNQADLMKLEEIMKQLKMRSRPYSHLQAYKDRASAKRPFTLKRFATIVRFVVRCKIAARNWAVHEATKEKLLAKLDEYAKRDRMKKMSEEFRLEQRARLTAMKGLEAERVEELN